jgi:signal transduction histidine kinase/HAMP domain-containing protein
MLRRTSLSIRRLPLGGLLSCVNVGLLLLALGALGWAALALLLRLGGDAGLPAAELRELARRLLVPIGLLAAGLALLVGLANLLLGRMISRPLGRLTAAAAAIGRSDLEQPTPRGPSAEIDALAGALDEMRLRLLTLTADMRRQQAESAAVLSGIVEGVYAVDRERRVRYINPQAAAMLGVEPAAAVGRFCGDLLRPRAVGGVRPCEDHCPIVHARFRQGARTTEHLVGADGRVRSVVITSSPLVDEAQVQVLRDETELETSRRLRDTLIANISHEFRTPLSAQLASIELLRDQLDAQTPPQVAQLVGSLQRSTLRLTQLVDNLLESARVEAGQDGLRRGAVHLDELVEGALELVRPLLVQRGQQVAVQLPFPPPTLAGDAPRLTQVLVNLLANAHKYAPAGSTIRVGAAAEGATLRLWVADEGPGSPLLRDGALFERFVRAPGDEPEQSGVGLGLWICKSIVERHGGSIGARSGPGGAVVTISLPVGGPP